MDQVMADVQEEHASISHVELTQNWIVAVAQHVG